VHGRTAAYLYEVLTTFGISSDEVYLHLKRGAVSQPLLESVLTSTVDYSLAYEIIFGNIDVAPLHVNDALASVAAWRLRHSQEVQK
jgi:hypothetical protein